MNDDGRSSCKKVGEEVIRKAYCGDDAALCYIISHYQNYVKKGIRNRGGRYGFSKNDLPVDDISQMVWIKFVTKNINGFKELD